MFMPLRIQSEITHEFKKTFYPSRIKKAFDEKISKKDSRGIDGLNVSGFEKQKDAQFKVINKKCLKGSYNFSPYLEKLKLKGRDKPPRKISLPTVRDRIVNYLIKEFLHKTFSDRVSKNLAHDVIRSIQKTLSEENSDSFGFSKIDITNFYDSINQQILIKYLKRRIKSKTILHLIIKAIQNISVGKNYNKGMRGKKFNDKGVPQGLAISNILADIYLTDVDKYFKLKKILKRKIKYFRYVDDIFLIYKKSDYPFVSKKIKEMISELILDINPEKSFDGDCADGFEYLGYKFIPGKKTKDGFPLLTVRQSSVDRYMDSLIAIFTTYWYTNINALKYENWRNKKDIKEAFIEDLNQKITGSIGENRKYGWIYYYVELNDLKLLFNIDKIVEGYFKKLKEFNFKPPLSIKKIVKAYYQIKFNFRETKYLHDYRIFDTCPKKKLYLKKRGYIKPWQKLSCAEIEKLFNVVKRKYLRGLEMDEGRMS